MLADVIVPGDAGDRRNDLAGGHVKQIVVGKMTAETGSRLHEAQFVNDLVAGVSRLRPEQQIAFTQAHAAAVRKQVADGHFVRNVGVVHHKAGQTLVDGVVPGEFTFVDQRGQRRGGEGFGIGPDAEHGVLVDRRGFAHFAHTIAFGHDYLAIFDDGHGDAGDVEGFHRGGDIGVQIGLQSG